MLRVTALTTLLLLAASCVVAFDDWVQEPHFVNYEASEERLNDKTLDAYIEMNVGKLEIQAGDRNKLYGLDIYYDGNAFEPNLDFRREDEIAWLHFQLQGRNRSARRLDKTRLSLRINPETRLRLRTETAVAESEIDLTGLSVESLRLQSGVGSTKLAMLSANPVECDEIRISNGVGALEATGLGNMNFNRLIFEGGVGGAELDFSGAWRKAGEVRVEVGVGGMELKFPRDLGVELSTAPSIFSSINTSRFEQRGGRLLSKDYDQAATKIKVSIRGGIGGVDIDFF